MARATEIPWDSMRLLLTDELMAARLSSSNTGSDSGVTVITLSGIPVTRVGVVWQIDNGYPYAAGPDLVWVGDKPVTLVATANAAASRESTPTSA